MCKAAQLWLWQAFPGISALDLFIQMFLAICNFVHNIRWCLCVCFCLLVLFSWYFVVVVVSERVPSVILQASCGGLRRDLWRWVISGRKQPCGCGFGCWSHGQGLPKLTKGPHHSFYIPALPDIFRMFPISPWCEGSSETNPSLGDLISFLYLKFLRKIPCFQMVKLHYLPRGNCLTEKAFF